MEGRPGGRPRMEASGKYDGPDGAVEPIGLRRVVATHTFLPRTWDENPLFGRELNPPQVGEKGNLRFCCSDLAVGEIGQFWPDRV